MLYLKSPLTSLGYILSWTTTKTLISHYIQSWWKFIKRAFQRLPRKFKDFWRLCKPCYSIIKVENCLKLLSTSLLCPQRAIIHQKQTFYHCVDLGVLVQKTLLGNITLTLLWQKSVKQLDLFQNFKTTALHTSSYTIIYLPNINPPSPKLWFCCLATGIQDFP